MRDIIDLVGRVFLSFIFLFEAYDTIVYFSKAKEKMDLYGITWNQGTLLYICCFLLVLGGILVLIGYRSTFGAVLLLFYFVPVTLVVHDFWNEVRGSEIYRMESILFMKNLAIIGALMIIAAGSGTSGRYSIRRLFATTHVGKW